MVDTWLRLGLISETPGGVHVLEIVCLRVLIGLLARGVATRVIRASLQRLDGILPQTGAALLQLERLAQHADELIAEFDACRTGPDGQMMLGFGDDAALCDEPVVLSFANIAAQAETSRHAALSADEWLERGRLLEEREHYEAAARAYRQSISRESRIPEAYFNLGNALRALGRAEAAAEMYQLALAQDSTLACAWYNLADLAEEAGRLDEAIGHLQRALQACPDYADAHFNLAHCLEAAGRKREADRHWTEYLRHDPESEWAALARRRLGRWRSG
jgi:tetratricopeptide (TPR) repeat protein